MCPRRRRWLLRAVLAALLPAGLALATTTFQYDEDFFTTQYRDPALTTAWWDTTAGEIKLFPIEIVLAGTFTSPGSAYGVATADTIAYLADDTAGLQLIGCATPGSPTPLGACDTPGSARGVALAGSVALVADGSGGLQVVDVADPAAPQIIGSQTCDGFAHAVAVTGSYAFVAQSGSGVQVFHIGDPADPIPAGSCDTPGWAQDVALAGGYAFVADGNSGLQVIDVSDPGNPVPAGSLPIEGYAFGLAVSGSYAYVAAGDAGLQVVDIDDPASPVAEGAVATPGSARDLALAGELAYLAAGDAGFQLLDLDDPANPVHLGGYPVPGVAHGAAEADDCALVAGGAGGLHLFTVDLAGFNQQANTVVSQVIDLSTDTILRARITTSQTDSIRWELSASGGAAWEEVAPGDSWHEFGAVGQELLWRSTHIYLGAGVNPACTQLRIEWEKAFRHAVIDSIRDVPDDQGLQVRIHFTASVLDTLGSPTPILEYAVFRRIDDDLAARTGFSPDLSRSLPYPPGDWDFLLTVPADTEDRYATVVPTLADSTAQGGVYYSTFFVRARTAVPGVHFDSAPDSGYSMNNLLPTVPEGFAVAYHSDGNLLTWLPCPDEDFLHFNLYRGEAAGFPPVPANLVHTTAATNWLDPGSDPWHYHYLLAAVDTGGNESPAASPGSLTGAGGSPAGFGFALAQNFPNPCNTATEIRYVVPGGGGPVLLEVFDLRGRLVRTLVNAPRPAGPATATWDGRDDRGRRVAAGVYSYRLSVSGRSQTRKLTLLE